MKKSLTPKYTIIIPVRSINDYLKESIEHLKGLNYINFEVIIVVDHNPDQDEQNFLQDERFRLVASGSIGPGEKRNLGAEHAKGDILAFLDDDAYPTPDWLANADLVFTETQTYAVGGPAITPVNATFLERCSGRVLESSLTSGFTTFRHLPQKNRLIDDYPTVNLLVKKSNFQAVGGFDINFWPGEDTKICLDLVKKFGQFVYDPRPIVYHHRREINKHFKQIARYGRHRGHFARIFPENSRIFSYFVPSLFVLGVFGGIFTYKIKVLFLIYLAVMALYAIWLTYESVKVIIKDKSLTMGILVGISILITHIVYGINFLIGFFKRPRLELKKFDTESGNYVEG